MMKIAAVAQFPQFEGIASPRGLAASIWGFERPGRSKRSRLQHRSDANPSAVHQPVDLGEELWRSIPEVDDEAVYRAVFVSLGIDAVVHALYFLRGNAQRPREVFNDFTCPSLLQFSALQKLLQFSVQCDFSLDSAEQRGKS